MSSNVLCKKHRLQNGSLNNRCPLGLRAVKNILKFSHLEKIKQVMFGRRGSGWGEPFRNSSSWHKNSAESLNFEILVCFQHSYILLPWPPRLVAVSFVPLNDLGDCTPLCVLSSSRLAWAQTYFRSFPCSFRGEQKSARLSRLSRAGGRGRFHIKYVLLILAFLATSGDPVGFKSRQDMALRWL